MPHVGWLARSKARTGAPREAVNALRASAAAQNHRVGKRALVSLSAVAPARAPPLADRKASMPGTGIPKTDELKTMIS